jgi:hypothetical protein
MRLNVHKNIVARMKSLPERETPLYGTGESCGGGIPQKGQATGEDFAAGGPASHDRFLAKHG